MKKPSSTKTYVVFAVILLLGIFLRFHQLDAEDLWSDEVATIRYSSENLSDLLTGKVVDFGNPPGYYVLVNVWMEWFGNSAFSLRVLPALFSLFALVLIFFVARRIAGDKAALLATFIMALDPLQIVYAQEVRVYSLFVFGALLLANFLLKIRESSSIWNYIFFSLVIIVLNYIHYTGILLFVFGNVMFYILESRRRSRVRSEKWLFFQFLVIIALLPLLKTIFNLILFMIERIWFILAGNSTLLTIFVVLCVIALLVVLLLVSSRSRKKFFSVFLRFYNHDTFFSFIVTVVLLAYLASFQLTLSPFKMFLLRYSLFLFPFLYILIAERSLRIQKKNLKRFLTFLFLFVFITGLAIYFTQPTKEQWSHASSILEDRTLPGEPVLFDSGSRLKVFNFYHPDPINSFPLESTSDTQVNRANITATMDTIDDESLWLVLSHNWRTGYYYRDVLVDEYDYGVNESIELKHIELLHMVRR